MSVSLLGLRVRAHAHTWCFLYISCCGFDIVSFGSYCCLPVSSLFVFYARARARMRTCGVFRTSRRSVIHHLHLLASAGVFFLRVVSARACAHVVFFNTCRAAASTWFCGASPGPLLGFSWAYLESSWAPPLSWVLETCHNYERGYFVSQITAPKSLRVEGVGFVLQNTAPNASA